MEIIDLFKVPIASDKIMLDKKPILNKINKIKNYKNNKRSNVGGKQYSLKKNFNLKLVEILEQKANLFAKKLDLKVPLKLDHMWVNINKKDSYNISHLHPQCQLSGVLYLDVPLNSGHIIFHNPVGKILSYDWGENNINRYNNYTASTLTMRAESLRYYLFPSWLIHEVEINKTNKKRMAISFNFKYESN